MPPDAGPDPGLGVFETLLVRDGRIDALDAHLRRLSGSLRRLYGAALPAGLRAELTAHAATLDAEQRLRVDVVPDAAGGAPAFAFLSTPLVAGARRPVALAPALIPGGLGAHKWRDRRRLEALGGDAVALLTDRDGSVLEGAWGNVWLMDGDRLATPPADGRILPGVTRARLLELAPRLGFSVTERRLTLADLAGATVLLTSALRLAVPAGIGTAPARTDPAIERLRHALWAAET